MSIKLEVVFDVAWDVYRSIRADLEGVAILDPTKPPSDHLWRSNKGPRAGEYVADFALACGKALEGPENDSRKIMCNLYVIGLTPWDKTRYLIGLRDDVAAQWLDEIKRKVGKELLRRGIFPVKQYFGERSRQRKVRTTGLVDGKVPSAHSVKVSTYGIAYVQGDPSLFKGLKCNAKPSPPQSAAQGLHRQR